MALSLDCEGDKCKENFVLSFYFLHTENSQYVLLNLSLIDVLDIAGQKISL